MSSEATVLITGGTGKLGRLFLQGFSKLGATIFFTTRDAQSSASLCAECLELGATRAQALKADLSSEAGVSALIDQLRSFEIQPSVLINNARSIDALRVNGDGLIPSHSWHEEFQIGIVAAYQLAMACSRFKVPPCSIINISSMYGVTAANRLLYDQPDLESAVNYGVVKSGLIHLTKELAVRLAPRIRVNAVSFGGVRGRVSSDFEQRYSRLCPAGGMLTDKDVFGAVEFLSGSASSGMTGHNVVVDGGWTVW
jgi:NAD(P)-dependent dehydrogenase (short-subunit alcohol dehydrogenase family)